LEIDTNDELEGVSHDEFDVDECANFEVEIKANKDLKVDEEDQDHTQQEYHYFPPQNDQDLTPQEDQDYLIQEYQDNPHHNDLALLDIIIHHEVFIKIILQNTLYDDFFLCMCCLSRSHHMTKKLTSSTRR
jgi:hypothetical protein